MFPRKALTSVFSHKTLSSMIRRSVSSFKMLDIETTDKEYYIMNLNRKPVNSMNYELLKEMNQAIKELEADKKCRGVVISSKLPVFSAGLDLFEMYEPNVERMTAFWREFKCI